MAIELSEWSHSRPSWASLHSDDRSEQAASETPRKPQFQSGWRFSLFLGTASCAVIFIINLAVTIWATTRNKKNKIGLPVLREGRCSDMRLWNSGLHLLINALSSVLLAASNYAMQCLSAPTRADIDKAHFEGKWLDIGVPSAHNLNHIPKNRYRLWLVLAVTSLPLHLVYNSVVFSSLATVSYDIWTVDSRLDNLKWEQHEFFQRHWNISDNGRTDEAIKDLDEHADDNAKEKVAKEVRQIMLKESKKWDMLARLGVNNELQKLTNLECIRQFATSFQTSHESLILVTAIARDAELQGKATFRKNINIVPQRLETVYYWICGNSNCAESYKGPCLGIMPALEKEADTWAPWCDKVEFCYSKPKEEKCQLTFSPVFMAFVLVSNALKAIVLFYIASTPPDEALFVLGDAIESFMTVPDAFSSGGCLASVDGIRQKNLQHWSGPRIWSLDRRLWGSAISPRRWKASMLLYLVSLSLVLFFLIFSIRQLPDLRDMGIPGTLWRLGFGAVTELTLIKKTGGGASDSLTMTQSVLLASLPHLVFSSLYFQYNALFTGMLAANEWSDLGRKRKGLRVSSEPRGEQRARYFLQLPYRWSIPLILMSMIMHWMLSQSIFIVPIEFEKEFLTTCGYSPMAIVAVFLAGIIMALAVIITACRRLPTAMPVVGSCSLGIAASCHGLEGTERPDDPLVPLRWGAMAHPEDDLVDGNPGDCGFSGGYVEEPQEGGLYS